MCTARPDKIDIWSCTEAGNQAQAIRMVIEDQNAPYRFAANVRWNRRRNDGEKFLSA
jgi:hypothetical protein